MPIYEYRRPDGTTFEIQQSFSDDALSVDPETGVPVERVLHPPAVHFKGKGFYNTDYGTRSRQRESAAEKSSSNGDSGSGEGKSSSTEKSAKSNGSTDTAGSSKQAKSSTSSAGGSSSS
ncbi:MAG TPA: zinc ribbon domain-containing protein [Solirubrobacteraceae bacterium]|nr:zinc ribbon domain-containing protein [Solirubrobacteraceae bacterium]